MRNIDRLARFITKHGAESIMVHTIYGTSNWVICQKIEPDKWLVTLCNPMGNVTYNLGTVSNKQHLQLWSEITRMEIEKKTTQILLAKGLKKAIHNFKKKYAEKNDKNKKYKTVK